MKIIPLDIFNEDERGYASEYEQDRTGKHILVFTRAGITRGRHYHKGLSATKNPEIIVLISGTCIFTWRHINEQEVKSQTVIAPARIEIPALIWHELTADTDCTFIEFNSREEHSADTFYN